MRSCSAASSRAPADVVLDFRTLLRDDVTKEEEEVEEDRRAGEERGREMTRRSVCNRIVRSTYRSGRRVVALEFRPSGVDGDAR